jgi:hypothetical protein
VSRTSRAAVALAALAFVRSATVGGAVVAFLALAGAVGRRTTVWLAVAVVVTAVFLGLGSLALARWGSADGTPSDRA